MGSNLNSSVVSATLTPGYGKGSLSITPSISTYCEERGPSVPGCASRGQVRHPLTSFASLSVDEDGRLSVSRI